MSQPGEAGYGDFPLKQHLGMTLEGGEPGVATANITIGPEHLNPNGVVHGAVLFALVDTAMGRATMSQVHTSEGVSGRFCASIEVSLRFLRPAVSGRIMATASVVKIGRHVTHLDARVVGDGDRVIATAAGTFALIDP